MQDAVATVAHKFLDNLFNEAKRRAATRWRRVYFRTTTCSASLVRCAMLPVFDSAANVELRDSHLNHEKT